MFTFRLEPLITIRDNALKARQKELANALNVRRTLEESFKNIERQLEEGITAVRNLMQTGQTVDVNFMLGFRQQEMFLRFEQDKLKQQISDVDKKIVLLRADVVQANKELKIVEKLKEKQYEKYLKAEEKAETNFLDEIAGRDKSTAAF